MTNKERIEANNELIRQNNVKLNNALTKIAALPTPLDTSDATATASDIKTGKTAYVDGTKITGTHTEPTPILQDKTVTITENGTQTITADTGNDGLNSVEITTNVPSVIPTGTINITENGEYDVAEYGTANVNVSSTAPEELYVTHDGTYTNVNGYSPVTVDSERLSYNLGAHTDENGIWHKPDDWDDIESMDLTGKNEAYILCGTKLNPYPFVRLRVYFEGAAKWSYGHISNGVYTIHENSTETSLNSGQFIALDMQDITDEYIVIRIQSTSYLKQVVTAAWTATTNLPYALSAAYNCILMAYMRLYKGSSMSLVSMYVESIKHIDFSKYYENSSLSITVSSAFSGNYNLQRVEFINSDFKGLKVNSFASMFGACFSLSYLSNVEGKNIFDLSNIDTSDCTTFGSMFSNCWSLTSKLILKNFNLSKTTTLGSMFYCCRSLKTIEGIETWTTAPVCTTINSMFAWCMNLEGTVDLSNLYLGNGTADFKDFGSAFYYTCALDKVILNNSNFSKVTTMASAFYYSAARRVIMDTNFTPPSSLCTSYATIFYNAGIEEIDISGWDFNGTTAANLTQIVYSCNALKKIIANNMPAWTRTATWADTSSSSSIFRYCYRLEYADVSWFDISICTSNYAHNSFKDNPRLINFYPPQNIYKNMSLNGANLLTPDSLNRVISNLKTVTSKTTLTLGAINKAKLTDEEIAVATSKGWTVSA